MRTISNVVAITLGVTCAMLASSLLLQHSVGATTDSKGARAFYLTATAYTGDQALTACAAGYHMASLWEIFDPSHLAYETTLGHTTADAGVGPPSGVLGWIRTGSGQSASSIAGDANCNTWNPTELFHGGSAVSLSNRWNFEAQTSAPWRAFAMGCSASLRVWCVGD